MSYQSWVAREVDLLLNGDEADEDRGDAEILKDLKHFVHCSQELSKRDPTIREKLYFSYLQMLYIQSGLEGEFDFYKLENRLLTLMEAPAPSIKFPPEIEEHRSGLFGHRPTLSLQTPDWADGYREAILDVKLMNEVTDE